MRRGTKRTMGMKGRRADCARNANRLPSVAAIVASNAGDFGEGRVRCSSTSASRSPLMLEAQQAQL